VKVTLCYPSLLPGQKPKYGLQPLGILYIAAVLRQHGINVKVFDADIDGLTVDEIVRRILSWEPDLVGFSLMTPQLMTALEASARLKEAWPDVWIALGGAHIDSTHEDVFSMADCFDFAVYGEGELTMLEVVQNMQRYGRENLTKCLAGVRSVIYKDETGHVVSNPPRPFLPDLDVLPSIDYDMVDINKYSIPTMAGKYVISMMLSRGCPFKCTFCDAPITMGRRLRFCSIKRVINDLRYYVEKYGCRNFVFKDSTFTANRRWAESFCDALVESSLRIKWRCNTRVNLIPRYLLEKMKKAGCYVVNFGVESGHPKILRSIKKEVSIEAIYDAHRRCRKLGIRTYATFLIGCPGETKETAQATIDVARGIRPNLAMFFICTAYPGTPLYEQAVQEGIVEPRWWATQVWDPTKSSAFQVRWGWTHKGALKIPGFDVERWQKRATRAFYFRPYFIWDTILFTLSNPYFIRHIINLGMELLPFYTIPLPWKKSRANEQHRAFSACPSAPTSDYEHRDITRIE